MRLLTASPSWVMRGGRDWKTSAPKLGGLNVNLRAGLQGARPPSDKFGAVDAVVLPESWSVRSGKPEETDREERDDDRNPEGFLLFEVHDGR
jgi:hypothetical protein